MALLIQNIGEFFTGELAQPTARVNSIRVENGRITALDPEGDRASADTVLDAAGGAVMPGLVDGHVHPVLGEWTPAQDAIGWIGNYLHGGTTTMISAGELHIPGIDYENLSAELVTSLAVVTAATTGRVRWSGVKVYAGTALLVPKMTELHFDRLAAAGVKWVKFLFYPFSANTEEARNYVAWSHARGMRVKVHTGGVSRSGSSVVCGYQVLSWLQPDIAAHVSGGPIPMSDEGHRLGRRPHGVCTGSLLVRQLSVDTPPGRTTQGAQRTASPDTWNGYTRRNRRHSSRYAAQRPVSRVHVWTDSWTGHCGGNRQHREGSRCRCRRSCRR